MNVINIQHIILNYIVKREKMREKLININLALSHAKQTF
jgi:hypothetical protein